MDKKTTSRVTRNEVQRQMISEFMSKNPDIKCGNFAVAKEKWKKIAVKLNQVPGGARKDWTRWRQTYYDDLRTKAKETDVKVEPHDDDAVDEEGDEQHLDLAPSSEYDPTCTTATKSNDIESYSFEFLDCSVENQPIADKYESLLLELNIKYENKDDDTVEENSDGNELKGNPLNRLRSQVTKAQKSKMFEYIETNEDL